MKVTEGALDVPLDPPALDPEDGDLEALPAEGPKAGGPLRFRACVVEGGGVQRVDVARLAGDALASLAKVPLSVSTPPSALRLTPLPPFSGARRTFGRGGGSVGGASFRRRLE